MITWLEVNYSNDAGSEKSSRFKLDEMDFKQFIEQIAQYAERKVTGILMRSINYEFFAYFNPFS